MTQIRSEIPASVWQVKFAEGDQVDVGAQLIVPESIQMEIPVVAPVGGTVSALPVQPDDRVREGDLLAELA